MPVTFASDLKDLKDYDYVQQVPLDAMFKNLGYKQQKFDQNASLIQRQSNALIVDALGQDAAARDQLLKTVNDELSKFAGADLTDQGVANQISGFISQVSKAPELVASQSRYNMYNQMLKEKQDAERKGKVWINEGLEKANEYYSSGQFDPNVRFQNSGFEAPDLEKTLDDIAKGTPEFEKWKANGSYDDHYKEKSLNTLFSNYALNFEKDPKLARYYDYLYRKSHVGDQADAFFGNHAKLLSELIPNLPGAQQQQALRYMDQLNSVKNSPAAKAAARSYLRELWFRDQAYEAAEAKHYISQVDHKANEFAKMGQEHLNRMSEQENQAWLNSGAQLDAQGNKIINAVESRDTLVPDKYTIKKADGTTESVVMDPNLAAYYKVVNGKDYTYAVKNKFGVPATVDLSLKSWMGMGPETKKSLGAGWVQINDPTFILPILDKVSRTESGVTTSFKNLAYDENGKPAIYVKNGRIVYGLAVDNSGGTATSPKNMEFRELSDENSYYRALYNSPAYKAADKKLLAASKAKGNIFNRGTVSEGSEAADTPVAVEPKVGTLSMQEGNSNGTFTRTFANYDEYKKYAMESSGVTSITPEQEDLLIQKWNGSAK